MAPLISSIRNGFNFLGQPAGVAVGLAIDLLYSSGRCRSFCTEVAGVHRHGRRLWVRRECRELTGNIAGCCTGDSRCPATMEELPNGMDRVSTSMANREQRNNSSRAPRRSQRSEFYLAEGQRLGHIGGWVFKPAGALEYSSDERFRIYGCDPESDAPTLDEYLACIIRTTVSSWHR
jgi:hypothetical protein